MKDRYGEDFNEPEYEKVSVEYLHKIQENEENLKKAIELIIDELNSDGSNEEKLEDIKEHIDDLQEVLHYL